jgi:hypothetical protein
MEASSKDLLSQCLKTSCLSLGREQTKALCEKYLNVIESDVIIDSITSSGDIVASAGHIGDVYIKRDLLPSGGVQKGSTLHVRMIKTVSGRTSCQAMSAEQSDKDSWHTATYKGRQFKQKDNLK